MSLSIAPERALNGKTHNPLFARAAAGRGARSVEVLPPMIYIVIISICCEVPWQ